MVLVIAIICSFCFVGVLYAIENGLNRILKRKIKEHKNGKDT